MQSAKMQSDLGSGSRSPFASVFSSVKRGDDILLAKLTVVIISAPRDRRALDGIHPGA